MEIKIHELYGTHQCSVCEERIRKHSQRIFYHNWDGSKTTHFKFIICEYCIQKAKENYKLYSKEHTPN